MPEITSSRVPHGGSHPPPRLLFYTHAFVAGGAERIWAELATAFHRQGWPVSFVVDRVKIDGETVASRERLDPAIPLTVLDAGPVASVRHLARVLAEQRPTVALSAVGGSNVKLALAQLRSQRLAGATTRLILSYHGYDEWRTGKLAFAAYAGLPWLGRRARRIIAVSDGLRNTLVRRWHAPAERTVRIYNPVSLPEMRNATPQIDGAAVGSPLILAVGRLVADKDYPVLLEAFALLRRRREYADARLAILGDGPERGVLQAQACNLGIDNAVEMPGHVAPAPWYARARILALSSRSEAFGNVIVEALAHGLPVIATRSGGPDEILDGPALGELVPVGDAPALAAALGRRLIDPGPPAPRMAHAAKFSFAVGFAAYERLIREVVAEP